MRWRRAAVAGVVSAGVGVVVARAARARPQGGAHQPLAASRRARGMQTAHMVRRVGVSYAGHRARRVFVSVERRVELDEAFQMRTAAHVSETLGSMKGVLMKIGQLASFLDDGMPEHVRDALSQ